MLDAADALVRFRASGAAAVDVVGVGRTGFRCENSAGANQGAIEDVLECDSVHSVLSASSTIESEQSDDSDYEAGDEEDDDSDYDSPGSGSPSDSEYEDESAQTSASDVDAE